MNITGLQSPGGAADYYYKYKYSYDKNGNVSSYVLNVIASGVESLIAGSYQFSVGVISKTKSVAKKILSVANRIYSAITSFISFLGGIFGISLEVINGQLPE